MFRFAIVIVFALSACSSDEGPEGMDGGEGTDGGPVECTPSGSPDALGCPAGCVSIEANVIDTEEGCVSSTTLVVACFSEDATAMGDGVTQCFHHVDDPSLLVRAPSDRVRVEGLTDDLLVYSGWVRCEEPVIEACP